ncbi:GNAT family N-acetyltransferase [Rugosimonospora africana]|uniref:GNAT family acetyltransferase n=1 Tax=Rugosimonospora africana TaxID=556532 RepID=A0A8J3QXI8_9ACTN|nr:GNAT family N-acetyltransferase [Rugosimonospora africana]GIH17648.1 GNAT family acetyltransferase [Rugosimonospora africana]
MPEFLTTERLILRDLAETDLDDLVALDNDPEVMRYLNGGKPVPREELRDTILPKLLRGYQRYGDRPGYWAAETRAGRQFLGWFALTPTDRPDEAELGYRLRRSAWGAGYGTEGSKALIRKGFTELGLTRVIAQTMAVNAASRRVMEKSGLIYARTFHETWDDPLPGTELGEVEYALDVEEWRRLEA